MRVGVKLCGFSRMHSVGKDRFMFAVKALWLSVSMGTSYCYFWGREVFEKGYRRDARTAFDAKYVNWGCETNI